MCYTPGIFFNIFRGYFFSGNRYFNDSSWAQAYNNSKRPLFFYFFLLYFINMYTDWNISTIDFYLFSELIYVFFYIILNCTLTNCKGVNRVHSRYWNSTHCTRIKYMTSFFLSIEIIYIFLNPINRLGSIPTGLVKKQVRYSQQCFIILFLYWWIVHLYKILM
jgi:hypothetical protein